MTIPIDTDEDGNRIYEVMVSSEHATTKYSIVVIEHDSKLNAINDSQLIECNFKNSDAEITEAILEVMGEFVIVITPLVLKIPRIRLTLQFRGNSNARDLLFQRRVIQTKKPAEAGFFLSGL
ncbi:hypothetical protein L1D37_07220 [Vibrio sp. Isolate33]|uniref:hypothetical protein n=1 Tax=Vibrio sp. Isolate33 TaxID=2908539 RepID=UPI001EFC4847|nr:hypothetical protein [Vibrio sp. Isolate33]MCG9543556.1 hypothetical protein [Vibrio sp. Isolate33]